MKRLILTSLLTGVAVLAQSTGSAAGSQKPQQGSAPAQTTVKKHSKKSKKGSKGTNTGSTAQSSKPANPPAKK